ncbi:hypothetical protein PG993_004158 [Apiospora rasikravindrae]|uniref:Uncharacterized protein n=1 Tax=Apiospora rasikravindrae TaxID=990691 RepID=A0ABR1TEC6_9PEZI
MRVLVERDPPPADASLARFHLAEHILHELGHAIWGVRSEQYQVEMEGEPYAGEEQMSELGFSFTTQIFGAESRPNRLPRTRIGSPSGQFFTLGSYGYPDVDSFNNYGQTPRDGWDLLPYGTNKSPEWVVPAFFCSYLFEQNYWDTVVSKKGTCALKHTRLTFVPTPDGWSGPVKPARHGVDEFRGMLAHVQGAMTRTTRVVKARYRAKNRDADREENMWNASLWGDVAMRKDIALFKAYHHRQDLRGCRRIAQRLIQDSRAREERWKRARVNSRFAPLVGLAIGYL